MKISPAGDNAKLIELGDVTAAELHAHAAAMRAQPGVLAVIPGHSSLYVLECGGTAAALKAAAELPHSIHRVRVHFDGPDRPPGFVPKPMTLTVRYLGFRAGFGYLDGWPEEWAMPRKTTSRPVRRGSFAVAGNVAGFYPIDTPGGWNILGHTDYDLAHALSPGDIIEIEPVDEPLPLPPFHEHAPASLHTRVSPPDWSRVLRGMPPGGPFDDVAAALLDAEELLECAMVWPKVEGVWVGPDLRTGDVVPTGKIEGGLRGYVRCGAGPRPAFPRNFQGRPEACTTRVDRHTIKALPGPHDVGIREIECEVTPQLDRVGIRLKALKPIDVQAPADMKSTGMQCGTLQLHPDGSIVAMGPDHPVTGGYLQPMTVLTTERWKLAQLSPGERVTFVAV